MTSAEQIAEWERQEEEREFNEACRVAQYDLWVNDDGSV